jgi:hypothetical protein
LNREIKNMKVLYYILTFTLSGLVTGFLLWIGHVLQQRISFLHDPVYVPSSEEAIESMLLLAQPRSGEEAVDLGSGDGRIVIALAQKGCRATGYEINPLLIHQSRKKILEQGLEKKAIILGKSFWKSDLSQTNIVILYTTASIMNRLETKLLRELKSGARVISQEFVFPNWKEKKKKGNIHLYVKD